MEKNDDEIIIINNNIKSRRRVGVLISHLGVSPPPLISPPGGRLLPRQPLMASETLTAAPSDSSTVFDKIINKEIPAKVVFEDDMVLAFRDIDPQSPTHILIIPKVKDGLSGLSEAEERHCDILGRLMYTAKIIAKQEGLDDGYRVVINDGPDAGQSVYHLHVHVIGGRQMNWPPG